MPDDGVWIVRRLRLRVERFPRMHEHVSVATWCSGAGGLVAERRSTVRGDEGGLVEAVALWVHLDPVGRAPAPDARGLRGGLRRRRRRGATCARACATAASRPTAPRAAPWRFRAADLDLADHVNNAVYWQVLEEELAGDGAREPFDAEIEHRAPADVGEATILRDGHMLWIAGADGEVLASLATRAWTVGPSRILAPGHRFCSVLD